MLGYFNAPNTTKIRPGQSVVTKDIGFLDEDGHLFILGRSGDQLLIGGRLHWFREVETVLYAHFDFLKISLRWVDTHVVISAVAMRNYNLDPASVHTQLRAAFGPEADDLFTLELVQSNTLLNEK